MAEMNSQTLFKQIEEDMTFLKKPQEPVFSGLPKRVATSAEDEDELPPLLRMMGRGAEAESPKSFEEFLKARQNPAQQVMDSMRTAFLASATGQKVKSQRDEFFEEYTLDQQKRQATQQQLQQNIRTWMQVRTSEKAAARADATKYALAEVNAIDNAKDREAKARELSSKLGIDLLKYMREGEENALQHEELPDAMHETFRKIVDKENPGLMKENPKEFFKAVEARVNKALLTEAQAKQKAEPGDTPVDPGTAQDLAQTIAEGGPIAQLRMIYKGTDAFPKAMQYLNSNHVILRDKAFNKDIATAEGGLHTLSQVHNLALEARELSADKGGAGFQKLTKDSEGLVGKMNGWITELEGKVGENAAARVLTSFVEGPVARRMAKAAGEGSRISDQDALAFIKALPGITNTPGEIDRLTEENKKVILNEMVNKIQAQTQFGGQATHEKPRSIDYRAFTQSYRQHKEDNPGATLHDYMIGLIQLGHSLDF